MKDILNENLQRKLDDLQRKREIHLHSFKSYKSEIQNKLFIIKKKAKHKKHKSGKSMFLLTVKIRRTQIFLKLFSLVDTSTFYFVKKQNLIALNNLDINFRVKVTSLIMQPYKTSAD